MGQRFAQGFVGIEQRRVLADHRDRHLALRLPDALDDRRQAVRSGSRRRQPEIAAHFGIEALAVIGDRHLIDRVDVERLDDARSGRMLQNSAILRRASAGISRSQRQSRMSGWIPTDSSSLTECWVGFVFSSPAEGIQGTSVRWMKSERSRPSSLPSWRMASRNGRLSMSPTVPPISQIRKSASSASARMNSLMASVTCGNHLHGGAQIVAAPFLGDHGGVDAAGGDVVARAGRHAGEALVVAEIEVGLGAVVGDVDLAMLVRDSSSRDRR